MFLALRGLVNGRMAAEAGEDFESLSPEAQLEWYTRFRARP